MENAGKTGPSLEYHWPTYLDNLRTLDEMVSQITNENRHLSFVLGPPIGHEVIVDNFYWPGH